MTKRKVLFSGRFDPVHPGHICQIIRLAKEYGAVDVVILDYDDRRFSMNYTKQIFTEIFEFLKYDINIISNRVHFAEITEMELLSFGCDLYVSGNQKVLRHIESLDFPVKFVEAAYQYSARDIPVKD